MKHIAFFFSRSPNEHSVVIDAFDTVMTAAIFDQKVSLIFNDLPWQAFVKDENDEENLERALEKLKNLESLPNIEVFISQNNVTAVSHNEVSSTEDLLDFLKKSSSTVKVINTDETHRLLKIADKVLSY